MLRFAISGRIPSVLRSRVQSMCQLHASRGGLLLINTSYKESLHNSRGFGSVKERQQRKLREKLAKKAEREHRKQANAKKERQMRLQEMDGGVIKRNAKGDEILFQWPHHIRIRALTGLGLFQSLSFLTIVDHYLATLDWYMVPLLSMVSILYWLSVVMYTSRSVNLLCHNKNKPRTLQVGHYNIIGMQQWVDVDVSKVKPTPTLLYQPKYYTFKIEGKRFYYTIDPRNSTIFRKNSLIDLGVISRVGGDHVHNM